MSTATLAIDDWDCSKMSIGGASADRQCQLAIQSSIRAANRRFALPIVDPRCQSAIQSSIRPANRQSPLPKSAIADRQSAMSSPE
jgi:hypothetical protein